MLLHDSRRAAPLRRRRARAARRPGSLALGRRGDRRGRAVLDRALALRRPRPRTSLQAAIAALHAEPDTRLAPDRCCSTASWCGSTGSPVVELNRAVAVAEADGPRGRPRARRRARPRRLPLLPFDARRPAAPARTGRGGSPRVPSGRLRSRTPIPSGGSSSGGWPIFRRTPGTCRSGRLEQGR